MKIERLKPEAAVYRLRQQELNRLLVQPTDKEARPCPGCRVPCPCTGSTSCPCACTSTCSDAPAQLSSDPDRYPVESRIVPLVYAFNCLRLFPPCWSCEGHYNASGILYKVPRVWFYSRSAIYPDIIAEYLGNLKIARQLNYSWQICVVHWGERLESTFSMEPRLESARDPLLSDLHDDVAVISANLHNDIRHLAHSRIAELTEALRGLE